LELSNFMERGMAKNVLLIGVAFIVGVWLALSQLSLLYMVNIRYASTVSIYLMIFGSWLIGMILGLWLPHFRYKAWSFLTSLFFLIFALGAVFNSPPLLLAIFASITAVVCGGWGMRFIREFGPYYSSARSILFWENNGFILGIILALLTLILGGVWVAIVTAVGLIIVPWLPLILLGPAYNNLKEVSFQKK